MDQERVVTQLERIVRAEVALTAIAFAGVGPDLPVLQWRALLLIVEADTNLRIRDLADRVGIAVPSASRLVRRLERRGLVSAVHDEKDRRVTRVHATERGVRIHDAVVTARRTELRKAVSGDGAIPADLEGGLATIAERLESLPTGR